MPPDPEPPPPPALPLGETPAPEPAPPTVAPGPHGPFHAQCENCGTPLAGPFCHQCGQHDFEFHRSFWHVFLELLENFLHFDAKLFGTTFTLLFRPGRLTAEFNAGKRTAQMPPFRLYLFVSVLFFFLLFLEGENPAQPLGDRIKPAVQSTVNGQQVSPLEALHTMTTAVDHPAAGDQPAKAPAPAQPERSVDKLRRYAEQMQAGQAHDAQQKAQDQSAVKRWLAGFAHRASEPAHRQEMVEHFLHTLPKLLLLCLPLFALLTRFLFRASGQVYLQHLVLAVHFHTFIYLWLLVRDGWVFLAGLPGWGVGLVVHALCNLWLYVYPFIMLRRLFANPWGRTILKTVLLFVAYFLTLILVLFASAVIIFLLL